MTTNYIIVRGTVNDTMRFCRDVDEFVNKGYVPVGSLAVIMSAGIAGNLLLLQPMLKTPSGIALDELRSQGRI